MILLKEKTKAIVLKAKDVRASIRFCFLLQY